MKEQMLAASVKPIIGLIKGMMKDVEPENPIAKWVADVLPPIIESKNLDPELVDVIIPILINFANDKPDEVVALLTELYNSFGEFYRITFLTDDSE